MNGLYIVLGSNGIIYGAYDNDDAAQECVKHVNESDESAAAAIRYIILNNNYWEMPEPCKYNELYNI